MIGPGRVPPWWGPAPGEGSSAVLRPGPRGGGARLPAGGAGPCRRPGPGSREHLAAGLASPLPCPPPSPRSPLSGLSAVTVGGGADEVRYAAGRFHAAGPGAAVMPERCEAGPGLLP